MEKRIKKWWVLACLIGIVALAFLDQTIVPVALPTIGKDLGMSRAALQWVVNAYLLTFAALVLPGGRLADLYPCDRLLQIGTILFGVASALCGFAWNGGTLITGRVLQAIGASIAFPTVMPILSSVFTSNQRGRALGIYIATGSIFLGLGPMVGGVLTQWASWRWIFWVNMPVIVAVLVMSHVFIKHLERKKPDEGLDFFGAFCSALGITSIVFSIDKAKEWGWDSPATLLLVCGGVALIGAFVLIEKKVKHPLLHLALFKNPVVNGASLSGFTIRLAVTVPIFWAIYFQTGWGHDPATAGLMLLPATIPAMAGGPIGGWLSDHVGPRMPAMLGSGLLTIGLVWCSCVTYLEGYWWLVPGMILFALGTTIALTPSSTAANNSVPANKQAIVSSFIITARQMGSSIGFVVMGSLVFGRLGELMAQGLPKEKALTIGMTYGTIFAAVASLVTFFIFILFFPKGIPPTHHAYDEQTYSGN